MRPLVAIETSGGPGGVAVLLRDGTVKERELGRVPCGDPASSGRRRCPEPQAGHSRTLVPEIKALVQEAGLVPGEIGAVAVSVGPGSYTGLRVGVTAAKTLSWALSCELVAVSTLEALAREAVVSGPPPETKRLVPAMDARRGQVYAALFEFREGAVKRLGEDEVLAPEELSRRLAPGDHVFGTAWGAYGEALSIPEGATTSGAGRPGPVVPSASTVARLGAEMLARGETVDCHTLAPSYLREWKSPSVREK